MEPKIVNLSIKRFRALRQLEIQGLARVNLITGRNNTGKSSVLEALRILACDAQWPVMRKILRFREESVREMDESTSLSDTQSLFRYWSLFHGFPQFSSRLDPIVISSSGRQGPMELSFEAGWLFEERRQDGSIALVPLKHEPRGQDDEVPAVLINTAGRMQRRMLLDSSRRLSSGGSQFRSELGNEATLRCVFVSPYGVEQTAALGTLWDRIALSDREKDVVDALRIIDPGISAVSMIGVEGQRHDRTAIVRSASLPRPVPLRSFGDGLNRLFGIILALVNANDGLLLIDEFENGMHHTVQVDVWRAVFKLARHLDTQVVATSHSWDAVEAFQKAASENPDEGVLIRLARKGDDIVPTLLRDEELAIATRDRIEVR